MPPMKADLDALMKQRNLDAIVVEGADGLSHASAAWNYLTCNQRMTGYVVKRRGEPAQILYHPMEQQQADASGLKPVSMGRWDLKTISKESATRLEAATRLWRTIIKDLELAGRIAWTGAVDASTLLALVDSLRTSMPAIEIVGEYENGVIESARRTKDADEIAVMEDVGRRTCEVVGEVVALLRTCLRQRDIVVDPRGNPLTIGAVKTFIRRACDERDLDVGDPIFAQGHDAGIPHAHGNPDAVLRVGDPIVFDIYPKCRRTGFYHDMTRTFAPGQAGEELQRIHGDVMHAFDTVRAEFRAGERCKKYQDRCCQVFRERGHKTIEDHWPLEEGYTHSLGHGLGLDVHEPLAFSSFADRGDTLEPGNVFTLEPGLYYPARGIGVRIEDTFVCDPDGSFRSITPFPYDLVIPLAN